MDQAKYFRTHLPRCIDGFAARPAEFPDAKSDSPIFALSCRCGGNRHYVHCYRWVNTDYKNAVVNLSPIILECSTCQKRTELLDTDIHGYDPEVGNPSSTARAKGDPIVFECPTCGRQPVEAFVQFEYPDDLFDEEFADFRGREQDLFTWFSLIGKCPQCSKVLQIADFECA